jgi:hypothetical protein
MKVSSFRTHVAIYAAAAGAAIAATMPVAAVLPTANADGQWGAASVTPDGKRGFWVTNYPDQAAAQQRVLQMCTYPRTANNCNVVVSFPDCGAVAQSGGQSAGGTGATQQAAEQAATSQLSGSTIRWSGCNDGGDLRGTSL